MSDIKTRVTVILPIKHAEEISFTLSDVICFLKGYRAGREGETDHADFISLRYLQDINIKIKDAINKGDTARPAIKALLDEAEKYRAALEEILEMAAETDDDMVADVAKQALGESRE